ncbi:MAG: hypothetical protein QME96_16635 [Myxococcota bacterium]|nr:hypothetical protein [Myxococcota bacterium]
MLCRLRTWLGLAVLAGSPGACSPGGDTTTGDTGGRDDRGADDARDAPDATVDCTPGAIACSGERARTCNAAGDGWESIVDCGDPTPVCADGLGCVACRPGEGACDGETARMCLPDGSDWAEDFCDAAAGERCSAGYCTDLSDACEAARLANSYEGCDYWPTQTSNLGPLDQATFRFALVIGSRQAEPANVEVLGPVALRERLRFSKVVDQEERPCRRGRSLIQMDCT